MNAPTALGALDCWRLQAGRCGEPARGSPPSSGPCALETEVGFGLVGCDRPHEAYQRGSSLGAQALIGGQKLQGARGTHPAEEIEFSTFMLGRIEDVEQVDHPSAQRLGDLDQTGERDPVGAVLIFLDLLEADVALLGKGFLGHADGASANPHGRAKRDVHRIGCLGRRLWHFFSFPTAALRSFLVPQGLSLSLHYRISGRDEERRMVAAPYLQEF